MVQDLGLDILQRQDTLDKHKAFIVDFKLARVAAGVPAEQAFPEYFPKPEVEVVDEGPDVDINRTDVEYDYSGVEWQGAADAEGDEALLAQFMASEQRVEVTNTEPGEWH